MGRKRILLTGATGNMGWEGFMQIYAHPDAFQMVILALPSKKERKKLKPFFQDDRVHIIWGDLSNYNDVKRAVQDVDIVLHVGALVSPMADHQPDLAWKVNYEGTKNIVDAVRERSEQNQVKLVYIGTVAETGNRAAPYHWGRVGDPLVPSEFDYYALSKIAAERYVIESGLPYWVSLRQTGIMHEHLLDVNDGIGYHMPLDNHMEWVTAKDSGRLLLKVCADDLPDEFWRQVYNIGGGESCRYTGIEFLDKMYGIMRVNYREFEDPNYYATRNFHGQWYFDSDRLEEFLHFRSESVDDIVQQIARKLPLKMRILRFLPKSVVRKSVRNQALKGDTPLRWERDNNKVKLNAFFGSRQSRMAIPGWDQLKLNFEIPPQKLQHGYNEELADEELNLDECQRAAQFRGGRCMSTQMKKGDLRVSLMWQCAHGHLFEASPFLILKTGHWCPECIKPPWNFEEQVKVNPFIAPSWNANPDPELNTQCV